MIAPAARRPPPRESRARHARRRPRRAPRDGSAAIRVAEILRTGSTACRPKSFAGPRRRRAGGTAPVRPPPRPRAVGGRDSSASPARARLGYPDRPMIHTHGFCLYPDESLRLQPSSRVDERPLLSNSSARDTGNYQFHDSRRPPPPTTASSRACLESASHPPDRTVGKGPPPAGGGRPGRGGNYAESIRCRLALSESTSCAFLVS
ncbi:hypothetical protein EVAR_17673_1 [Eumeta japonica]|uniref:Uncharacterized protein n=1 Tax=Eumeta variegata TaxID=151549 RepID=A0A4C1UT18_EUMVA|nr:hypothetical protein EVAR_17673_1 [Eumeta japonica]